MKLFCKVFMNSLAIWAASLILPSIRLDGLTTAILFGLVLTAINLVLRPILIIIGLPINLLTLGLFALLINTWMVMLAEAVLPGLNIAGFWPTFGAALVVYFLEMSGMKLFERKMGDRT